MSEPLNYADFFTGEEELLYPIVVKGVLRGFKTKKEIDAAFAKTARDLELCLMYGTNFPPTPWELLSKKAEPKTVETTVGEST